MLVVLQCRDIEKSKEFYKCLGLTFTKEKHGKGREHYASEKDGLVFELYPIKEELDDTITGVALFGVVLMALLVQFFGFSAVSFLVGLWIGLMGLVVSLIFSKPLPIRFGFVIDFGKCFGELNKVGIVFNPDQINSKRVVVCDPDWNKIELISGK